MVCDNKEKNDNQLCCICGNKVCSCINLKLLDKMFMDYEVITGDIFVFVKNEPEYYI